MRPLLDGLITDRLVTSPDDVARLVAFFQSECAQQNKFGWAPPSDLTMQSELQQLYPDPSEGVVSINDVRRILAAEAHLCAAQRQAPS